MLSMSKIAPPNGSCAQDAAGIAVANQCRHLLICFVPLMGSCSWFCLILHSHRVAVPFHPIFLDEIVLLYLFIQFFGRHSGTALIKFMAEQLGCRQNLGPPLKNDPKITKIGGWGHLLVQINPLLGKNR